MIGELGFNDFSAAHQQHAGVAITRGLNCAFHLRARSAVRAHGVHGNGGAGCLKAVGSKSGTRKGFELVSHHARESLTRLPGGSQMLAAVYLDSTSTTSRPL